VRITRLRLRNLRRHADLDLQPAPGLTVVRGPNESGKTSVQLAIELALFGEDGPGGGARLRRWSSPGNAVPSVELAFEGEGEEAGGSIERVFAAGATTVKLHMGSQTISTPADANARLAEISGIPTLPFFRSSASIHHEELAGLARDDQALRTRLSASVSAADRDLRRAMADLEATVRAIDGDGLPGPGPLRAASDEVARIEGDVQRGEGELARLARDHEALAAARSTLAEVEAQLESDRELLAASEEAATLLAEQREAEARYERFRRAAQLRADIAEAEERHPTLLPLPVLRDGLSRLRGLEETIAALHAQLGDEVDVSTIETAPPGQAWRRFAVASILLTLAGVAAAVVAGILAPGPAVAIGLVAAVLGLLIAIVALRQRRGGTVEHRQQLRGEQIARRLRGRSILEQELRDATKDREATLAGLGQADLAAAERLLADEEQHVTSVAEMRGELRGLLGDPPTTEDVALLRDRASADAEHRRHELGRMGEIGKDPAASLERYRGTVRDGESRRDRAMADEAGARGRVDGNPIDAEEVAAGIEALAAARERLAALERRRRILDGTLSALRAADAASMKRAARFLEQRMARDIEWITGGRYRRVQVGEDDLSIRTWAPELDAWVDVRDLSEATLGQVYLAARLGLVRQVTNERHPPLVLEDPFVGFDDARAIRALEVVRGLTSEYQVILLTCSDRYDEYADRVVVLESPIERDAPATAAEGL